LELPRERGVRKARRDLVVDAERALVEVCRADRAPDAVDRHHLLMQQSPLKLEDSHSAGEKLAEVAVCRVLHERQIGYGRGGDHDSHVDPARDGGAERFDRALARQEVRILNVDAPPRHADDEVIKDVHRRRRRSGRLHAGEVQRDVPLGLEHWEYAVADEELARLLDPILAEYALRALHGGAAQPKEDVAVLIGVLGIAEPGVLHAVPADEGDADVDDAKLPVIALVLVADLLQPAVMETAYSAARRLEPLLGSIAHPLAAVRVDQKTHGHACPCALGEDLTEPRRGLAVLPDIRLEVNGRARVAHLFRDRVEERAVLDQLDGVAFDQRAVCEADERRQKLLEVGISVEDEARLAIAAQRPDDEQEG